MSNVNKAIVVGRLGSDPDVRYTNEGTAYCRFSVATSEKYKDKEETTWHRIVVWGKDAESCGQYLSKGDLVYVEGKMVHDTYEKDGQTHRNFEIKADFFGVRFLNTKNRGDDGGGGDRDGGGQGQRGGGQGGGQRGQGGQQRGGGGGYGRGGNSGGGGGGYGRGGGSSWGDPNQRPAGRGNGQGQNGGGQGGEGGGQSGWGQSDQGDDDKPPF